MKKLHFLILFFVAQMVFAQYMIVGNDSISVQDFIKDNQYGLEHSGIEKTVNSTQEFMLLQQFAQAQKVDTTRYFKMKVADHLSGLVEKSFYPENLMDETLQKYVSDNRTERNILIFVAEKKEGDTNDYQKIYDGVVSGKMTMEDAIKNYTKREIKPMYIKPGVMDDHLYSQLINMQPGSYTKLINNSSYAVFAKLIATRPSLGYIVFGTVSYPNDADAEKKKSEILNALQSGKKFEEVAKQFGSSDLEKKNGGLVMGSPTLPDEVYAVLKGKKDGGYTNPILMENKYFIFKIYKIIPYQLNDDNREFFKKEMMSSSYFQKMQSTLIDQLKKSSQYKITKDFATVSKSYSAYNAFKNDKAVLAQYGKHILSFGDFKTDIDTHFKNLDKIGDSDWNSLAQERIDDFLFTSYSEDFESRPEIRKDIKTFKSGLYSEYIFSDYLRNEVENHPEWLTEYYNKNKSKYMWEERAAGRVAIVSDDSLAKSVEKDIKDPKNWESLKKKYDGKLNSKNQILVHFEEGEMSKDADIFNKYKVPFAPGVNAAKVSERTIVVAVDKILPPSQMTEAEAKDLLRDAVTEQKLQETIKAQRAKTQISVEPAFLKELEKNFKK